MSSKVRAIFIPRVFSGGIFLISLGRSAIITVTQMGICVSSRLRVNHHPILSRVVSIRRLDFDGMSVASAIRESERNAMGRFFVIVFHASRICFTSARNICILACVEEKEELKSVWLTIRARSADAFCSSPRSNKNCAYIP